MPNHQSTVYLEGGGNTVAHALCGCGSGVVKNEPFNKRTKGGRHTHA